MTDAAAKLRQFHSTTPVWAKEDRAVLLASADTIEAQAERIRVLREALEKAMNYARCDYASSFRPHFEHVMKQAHAALEVTK